MTPDSPAERVLAEIDAVHLTIRDAFRRRDLPSYTACLAPDLRYQGADGRVISRDGLARDVDRQFDRLVGFDSTFDRRSGTVARGEFTETGTQTAWITLRVFVVFAIRWKIERLGLYVWTRGASSWLLKEALIEQERVTRAGVGLASRMGAAS
jgi:Domain of unknown function (DUF4440)